MKHDNKIIVICGPTATGKSALAIELALIFNGEVISADSRQVYRGLDIGSAKVTRDEMHGVPHHLINVCDLDHAYTVAEFQEQARAAIADIQSRGRLPILCGGTGMYISAVIDNKEFPKVAPDAELRKKLEAMSAFDLFERLKDLDPVRAATIDAKNKVRLVRAIEIAMAREQQDPLLLGEGGRGSARPGEVLIIGLTLPKEELLSRIHTRIESRIPALFDEIKKLLASGASETRLTSFGLEYKYGLEYVNETLSLDSFKATLATKTWQYVRRQYTWLKKDIRVTWLNPIFDHQKILDLVQDFLK